MKCLVSAWILVFVISEFHRESAAIVYGYKRGKGIFPWHVGVYKQFSKSNGNDQYCGGTLISLDLVISAAHCFYDKKNDRTWDASLYRIIASQYQRDYSSLEDLDQEVRVREISIPPRYARSKVDYLYQDIALIRLAESFYMSDAVRPISIDWDNVLESEQLRNGQYGKIAGCGNNRFGASINEHHGITLPYILPKECRTVFRKQFKKKMTSDQFCAGYLNGSRMCPNDDGGGLCFDYKGVWYLRGILIRLPNAPNRSCDSRTYALFRNVKKDLGWIRAVYDGIENYTSSDTGCVLPEQPANGSFQLSSCSENCIVEPGTRVGKGSVLTYSCNKGYTVRGNPVGVCKNNTWDQSPKCIIETVEKSPEKPAGNQWIGYVVSVVFILALIPVVGAWMCYLNRREKAARRRFILATIERFNYGDKNRLDPELAMADQAELLPYDKSAEFPRKLLRLGKTLGSGAFGIVIKAEAKSICRGQKVSMVAVKMVRATHRLDHMMALQRELKVLAHLGKHLNIVNLLGACSDRISYGELFVIVEFCRFGNLRDYLMRGRSDFVDQVDSTTGMIAGSSREPDDLTRNDEVMNTADSDDHSAAENCSERTDPHSTSCSVTVADEPVPDAGPVQPVQESKYDGDFEDSDMKPIGTRDLLCWAWQVSRGMKFLGSKKVVHGDLAARNILLADNNVIKICDFGLAKALYASDIYKKEGNGPLPVKWMPIESIGDRVFSVKSDVWSFGVVLWELFTLGKTPYPGIANESVYTKLVDGYRMERPEYATEQIYNTMLRCWNAEPSERPPFEELETIFDDLLEVKVKTDYLDFDRPYAEINAAASASGKKDILAMSPAEYLSTTAESTV